VEHNTVGGEEEAVHPSANSAIEFSPTQLMFDSVPADDWQSLPVRIRSVGTEDLHLKGLTVEGSSSFFIMDDGVAHILPPGDEIQVVVQFRPVKDGEHDGVLHIASSAPSQPDVTVALEGACVAPKIELDPPSWDFGEPVAGCHEEQPIAIYNAGTWPLTIHEIVFSATSDELSHTYDFPDDSVLDPGESLDVFITYEARDELADTGYLYVSSNDPSHPVAMAVQHGTGQLAGGVSDEWEQEGNNWTDILWMVDNSCSMTDDQEGLKANFATFFDVIDLQGIDYHLGVVTSDDAALQGPIPIMTPSTPDSYTAFTAAVTVGTAGSGNEMGLRSVHDALYPPYAEPGGPNYAFLRRDAGLHIIFVSDEADQSPGAVADYVNGILALKDDPDDVTITAIIDPNYGQRYEQAATLTGGLVEFLDNPSWMSTLTQLAWLSNSLEDTFELSQVPVEGTVTVELNEVPVYDGWAVDPWINAVVFEPGHVPGDGDQIRVDYHPIGGPGECP